MDIAPIKNKRDYQKVLKEIEGLMDAKQDTPEGDRLNVLVTLVEAFERKHYPLCNSLWSGWRVKRHPGAVVRLARLLPHFAARNVGYSMLRRITSGLRSSHPRT